AGRRRALLAAVATGEVLCLAAWVVVQDLGVLGGVGTDPNSMLPTALVLLAAAVAATPGAGTAAGAVTPFAVAARRDEASPGATATAPAVSTSSVATGPAVATLPAAVVAPGTPQASPVRVAAPRSAGPGAAGSGAAGSGRDLGDGRPGWRQDLAGPTGAPGTPRALSRIWRAALALPTATIAATAAAGGMLLVGVVPATDAAVSPGRTPLVASAPARPPVVAVAVRWPAGGVPPAARLYERGAERFAGGTRCGRPGGVGGRCSPSR
ncbi:MAG TPA: hypothetical protein VFN73_13385, partial [Propionibacteriaceae bacterium]|nr:hypothetical protein [Propionibacteriaceae bacterium]